MWGMWRMCESDSKLQTRNPKLQTRNPKPETPNSKPETRNSKRFSMKIQQITSFLLLLFLMGTIPSVAQGLPDGFTDVVHSGGWSRIVGIDFDENGGMYAWEKGGKVYKVENGQKLEPPLLDITEEVGDWRDHGLLGFVLDPDFLENGHFYIYYAVDLHYLKYFGTSRYSPDSSITNQATIGRICRYTAKQADSFRSVVPGSRKVLLGEDISSGVPTLLDSHDGGTLLFGTDGSLLVSTGDGASHKAADLGGDISYAPQAIRDGIIPEEQDVGAYRSQQLESLNGKILRIDPQSRGRNARQSFLRPGGASGERLAGVRPGAAQSLPDVPGAGLWQPFSS
jgi:hypothetical protein